MALTARIRKRYGGFRLDVEFSVENGQTLALLGVSGCGKSVTLKCLAGIDKPDWGYIELDGLVLFDSEKKIDLPPQKRKIGYLFQQYALFPNMTVDQNIAACLGHLDRNHRAERVRELVRAMRLEDAEMLLPRQLSGGQQQRTALARILASEPRAILLDEPLSALDTCLRWQMESELQDVLASFGGPAVWVSHDRGEVYRNCKRVCVLDRGISSPAVEWRELMDDPKTVSAARISGCRNYVPFTAGPENGWVSVPCWGLTLRASKAVRPGAAMLGIRDDRVRLSAEGAENAFLCRVRRVTEDVSAMLVVLEPIGAAPDAPPLWMEVEKNRWTAAGRDSVWVAAAPEDVLLLEE